MPLGPGVRYRVKKTKSGNVRLAFKGNKVVAVKPLYGDGKERKVVEAKPVPRRKGQRKR